MMVLMMALTNAFATECYDAQWTPTSQFFGAFDIASSLTPVPCDMTSPGQHWVPVTQTTTPPLTRDIWIRGSFDAPEYVHHSGGDREMRDGPILIGNHLYRTKQAQHEPTTVIAPEAAPIADGALVTLVHAGDETCLVSSLGGPSVTALYPCALSEGFMEAMQYELNAVAGGYSLKADFNGECLFDDGTVDHRVRNDACVNGVGDTFQFLPVSGSSTYQIQHISTGMCMKNGHEPMRMSSCANGQTEFHVVRTQDPNTSTGAALPGKM